MSELAQRLQSEWSGENMWMAFPVHAKADIACWVSVVDNAGGYIPVLHMVLTRPSSRFSGIPIADVDEISEGRISALFLKALSWYLREVEKTRLARDLMRLLRVRSLAGVLVGESDAVLAKYVKDRVKWKSKDNGDWTAYVEMWGLPIPKTKLA